MRNLLLLASILSLLLCGSTSTLFAQTQSVAIEGVPSAPFWKWEIGSRRWEVGKRK